ncbi:MAG: hypothetical protein K8S54_02240 [Spirochaetia bacterium]|nr:hypothetical protein [Spirochaetia bacterium]
MTRLPDSILKLVSALRSIGAVFKYAITEGTARNQLITGITPIQRWMQFPLPLRWFLAGYFCFWSVCVSALLMDACGTAASHVLPPILDNPVLNSDLYGALHGALAIFVVSLKGYARFELIVKILVVATFALILYAGFSAIHTLPLEAQSFRADGQVLIALVTGIGGTLTVLSYGYWIRERGEASVDSIPAMRTDCVTSYVLSAIFNLTMICVAAATLRVAGVSIGSEGAAKEIFTRIGGLLGDRIGAWAFNVGFWFVVVGSLLGVWQSIPYFFVDGMHAFKKETPPPDMGATRAFFWFRIVVALIALPLLFYRIQVLFLLYSMVSSLFLPFLAATLLVWNNQKNVGKWKNGIATNLLLVLALGAYAYLATRTLLRYV